MVSIHFYHIPINASRVLDSVHTQEMIQGHEHQKAGTAVDLQRLSVPFSALSIFNPHYSSYHYLFIYLFAYVFCPFLFSKE